MSSAGRGDPEVHLAATAESASRCSLQTIGTHRRTGPVRSTFERDTDILRQPQYCPTWLTVKVGQISCDSLVCDLSDSENVVSTYNSYLWQGPGGIKTASLPDNIEFVKSGSKENRPQSSPDTVLVKTFCTSSQTALPDRQRTLPR